MDASGNHCILNLTFASRQLLAFKQTGIPILSGDESASVEATSFLEIARDPKSPCDQLAKCFVEAKLEQEQQVSSTKLNTGLFLCWTQSLQEREKLFGDAGEVSAHVVELLLEEATHKSACIFLDSFAHVAPSVSTCVTKKAARILEIDMARGIKKGRAASLWVDLARQFNITQVEKSTWCQCKDRLCKTHRWSEALEICRVANESTELLDRMLSFGQRCHEELITLAPRLDMHCQQLAVLKLAEGGYPRTADRLRRSCKLHPCSEELQQQLRIDLLQHLIDIDLIDRAESLAKTAGLQDDILSTLRWRDTNDSSTSSYGFTPSERASGTFKSECPIALDMDAIFVADNSTQAHQFAMAAENARGPVGLDCEWPPGERCVSICQVAFDDKVWILDLCWVQESDNEDVPRALNKLLADSHVQKIGFGFQEDLDRLNLELKKSLKTDLIVRNIADLQIDHRGLAALLKSETGHHIDKSLQCSAWGARPLSNEQLKYAAIDAFCLHKLHAALSSRVSHCDMVPRSTSFSKLYPAKKVDALSAEHVRSTLEERSISAQLIQAGKEGDVKWEEGNVVCFIVKPERKPIAVVTRTSAKVSTAALAKAMGCSKRNLVMASSSECVSLFGFPPGNIPPVGLREGVDVRLCRNLKTCHNLLSFSAGEPSMRLLLESTALENLGRWLPDEDLTSTSLSAVVEAMVYGHIPLRFACDSNLSRLARKLRALDIDVLMLGDGSFQQEAERTPAPDEQLPLDEKPARGSQRTEERRFLSQMAQCGDVAVLTTAAWRLPELRGVAYLLRGTSVEEHLREVCMVFNIDAAQRCNAPTNRRCWECNGLFVKVGKDAVADKLETIKSRMSRKTFEVYDVFFLCTNLSCGKVFWHGSTYAEEMWHIKRSFSNLCFRSHQSMPTASDSEPEDIIVAESCSGRAIAVFDSVPPVDGRCHSDRGYFFKSLGDFGQKSEMRYILTPNADKATPSNQVMWKLHLKTSAVLYLNFRSERHVTDTGASLWLAKGGWERSAMQSTVSTGIPEKLYSGPVYSKLVNCGTTELMGSNCQEGVYFVFVELKAS